MKNEQKWEKIGLYLVLGLVVALGGLFVGGNLGVLFNGMEYGDAAAVGVGLYLCVVVVTCTGIIVSKLDQKSEKTQDKEQNAEEEQQNAEQSDNSEPQ